MSSSVSVAMVRALGSRAEASATFPMFSAFTPRSV